MAGSFAVSGLGVGSRQFLQRPDLSSATRDFLAIPTFTLSTLQNQDSLLSQCANRQFCVVGW